MTLTPAAFDRTICFGDTVSHSVKFQGSNLLVELTNSEGVKTLIEVISQKQQAIKARMPEIVKEAKLPKVLSQDKKAQRKPQAKLTEEDVRYIRSRWDKLVVHLNTKAKAAELLSKQFHCSVTNIYAIVENRSWTRVQPLLHDGVKGLESEIANT